MHPLLHQSKQFRETIRATLTQNIPAIEKGNDPLSATSSVLFLISDVHSAKSRAKKPYLILTKRSQHVRQPGDLCFPGGGASPRFDALLAKLLSVPGFPFASWKHRTGTKLTINHGRLAQYLATSLRESYEEMRLLPLRLHFLGPLPPHRLILYDRIIYPMVAWTKRRQFYRANGEVEKLIFISFEALLDSRNYAFFRLAYPEGIPLHIDTSRGEMPCFLHQDGDQTEVLWGATYRIVVNFLYQLFGFSPPSIDELPRIKNHLKPGYFPTE